MPKNYFIGEKTDKSLYAESDRECRLCISYNIMELKEGYDINDPNRRTQFTESFERFTELFEKKVENPKPANTISFFSTLITYYICAVRAGAIKLKACPEGDLDDLTVDDIKKQSETLEDKIWEDINNMIPLVASLYNKNIDRLLQDDRKIVERMVDLGIMTRHGELTVEFKLFLEDYCKDQFLADYAKEQHIKSISELGQSDDSDTDSNIHKLIILIAEFIGMSPIEVMKLFVLKHRNYKAFDLGQMARVVKQCLRVKEA
jgi:hypothetical protein